MASAADMVPPEAVLGLIAGSGDLPLAVANEASARGRRVVAIALRGITDRRLGDLVDVEHRMPLGRVSGILEILRQEGVAEAVLVGKVPKTILYQDLDSLDDRARSALAELADQRDDSILSGVAGLLEAEGIRLCSQAEWVPSLMPGEGPLGSLEPSAGEWAQLVFGWPVAKKVAGLDIGQSVVVKDRAVLAVEAIEGTDEAILRGGEAGGPGATVVKVAKPLQDPRFDLPTIGLETLGVMKQVGATFLAFEARTTVVLDSTACAARADELGISLWGVPEEGPTPEKPPVLS